METARQDPAGLTRENPHAPLTVSAGVSGVGVGVGKGTRVLGGRGGEQTGAVTPASAPPRLPPVMGRQVSPLCVVCEMNGVTQSGSPFTVLARPATRGRGRLKWAVGLNMCS